MNKLSLVAAAVLVTGTFGAAAIAQDDGKSFEVIDGNKDKMVSLEEAKLAYPTLTDILFNQADSNGDGSLDETEYVALVGLTAGLDGNTSSESSAAPQ